MKILFVIEMLAVTLNFFETFSESCTDGQVRLVNGLNALQGRLEICVNETWGSVCNDNFDVIEGKVVCQQLGVTEPALNEVIVNIFFGGGQNETQSQRIFLDELQCSGIEQNLLECPHLLPTGSSDCFHSEDVGVICQRAKYCMDGDVRLVDGDNYNATEGRVEYCVGGLWGTVCNYGFEDVDAAVVCRQLGFNTIKPKALTAVLPVVNEDTPIVLDCVTCQGTETSLAKCDRCSTVEFCSHLLDAGASCTDIIECNDGDVRLIDGSTLNKGRVEFCADGHWGIVCFDSWDMRDATVVCRQLGYNIKGDAQATNTALPSADFIVNLKHVNCNGNESTLSQCPHLDTDCLVPGAGAICPMETIDITTVSEIIPTTENPQHTSEGLQTTKRPLTTLSMEIAETTQTDKDIEVYTTTESHVDTTTSSLATRSEYTTEHVTVTDTETHTGDSDTERPKTLASTQEGTRSTSESSTQYTTTLQYEISTQNPSTPSDSDNDLYTTTTVNETTKTAAGIVSTAYITSNTTSMTTEFDHNFSTTTTEIDNTEVLEQQSDNDSSSTRDTKAAPHFIALVVMVLFYTHVYLI